MRNYISKKLKDFSKFILARNYMRHCIIIEKDGRRKSLSKKYAIKDLSSYDCYSRKELRKLSLPDLLYEYIAVSTGGTSVYDKDTGKEKYVGYVS